MTRILVLYGTTDGQTRKVALHLGIALRHVGAEADVIMASPTAPSPDGYAGVIVAASLQAGRYQRSVRNWLRRHATLLRRKPGAFVSVCLMVRDPRESAQKKLIGIMRDFVDSCGWMPAYLKPVAGALMYTRYGWLKRWMIKQMAARTGGDTDTSRDHEYTDWDDVRTFATEFHQYSHERHGSGSTRRVIDTGMTTQASIEAVIERLRPMLNADGGDVDPPPATS